MNTIKSIFVSTLFALSLVSCNEFLGIKPKGSLYPETLDDFDHLLSDQSLSKCGATDPLFLTDDVYLPDEPLHYEPSIMTSEFYISKLYTFEHGLLFTDAEIDYFYEEAYMHIYTYNVVIDFVDELKDADSQKRDAIIAEARAGRAFEYLQLVNVYANHYDPNTSDRDLAVPLVVSSDIEQTGLSRATVKEVYDFILKELTESLPNIPLEPKNNNYRWSQAAAHAALARVYHIMGDYEQALFESKEVLKSYSQLSDYSQYKVINPNGAIGRTNMPERFDDPEAILIKHASYVYGMSFKVFASEELRSIFDKERDYRYQLLYAPNYAGLAFASPDDRLYAAWYRENIGLSSAEMYLVAAESAARTGELSYASELLNELKLHRISEYQPQEYSDADELLNEVLLERRRELALKGTFRYIDLKRLNKEERFKKSVTHSFGGSTATLEPNDPRYLYSIPEIVLRKNPGMPQNER